MYHYHCYSAVTGVHHLISSDGLLDVTVNITIIYHYHFCKLLTQPKTQKNPSSIFKIPETELEGRGGGKFRKELVRYPVLETPFM